MLIGSLYSDDERFDETFLSNYAIINLQNPIARLPGVGQVQVLGAGPYSMRIWLDPIKLRATVSPFLRCRTRSRTRTFRSLRDSLADRQFPRPSLPVHGYNHGPAD